MAELSRLIRAALMSLCGTPWALGSDAQSLHLRGPGATEASAVPARPSTAAAVDEQRLATEADLDTILHLALQRNPDIRTARARARAAGARVPAASRLPDLELKQENWGIPLKRPYGLDESGTVMLGVRQSFPPPGTRGAKRRAAEADAGGQQEEEQAVIQDIASAVRRAFYGYYRADREYWIHLEHVKISTEMVGLSRSNYQTGRGTQQDVLRTIVQVSSLHNDLAAIEQQRRSQRAMLNRLMARPPDAPLGPPPEPQPATSEIDPDRLRSAIDQLPELRVAALSVERSKATLEAVRLAAHRPSVMVGADYWLQPTSDTRHAYGTMVSINLPWLNPVHRDRIREASELVGADREALDSARIVALYRLEDAVARYEAARESFAIIERDLLPQAQRSFESSRAAFQSGTGDALGLLDALRSYFQVRIERVRALARLGESMADVDRAVGMAVPASLQVPGMEGDLP